MNEALTVQDFNFFFNTSLAEWSTQLSQKQSFYIGSQFESERRYIFINDIWFLKIIFAEFFIFKKYVIGLNYIFNKENISLDNKNII